MYILIKLFIIFIFLSISLSVIADCSNTEYEEFRMRDSASNFYGSSYKPYSVTEWFSSKDEAVLNLMQFLVDRYNNANNPTYSIQSTTHIPWTSISERMTFVITRESDGHQVTENIDKYFDRRCSVCAVDQVSEYTFDGYTDIEQLPATGCNGQCKNRIATPSDEASISFCGSTNDSPYCTESYFLTGEQCSASEQGSFLASLTNPPSTIGGNDTPTGDGTSTNSASIIASNDAITDSVNALSDLVSAGHTENEASLNSVTTAIDDLKVDVQGTTTAINSVKGSVDSVKISVDGVNTSIGEVQSALVNTNGTNKLDVLNQSVLNSKTDMTSTIDAINQVNTSIQDTKTELETITNFDTYSDNPDVPTTEQTFASFSEKLAAVPLVAAYQSISLSFGSSTCQTPGINFQILGRTVNGDLSMACDLIEQIAWLISLVMLFLFAFLGAKIVISA